MMLLSVPQRRGMANVVALDIEKEYALASRPGRIEKVAIVMLCSGTMCLIIQLPKMDSIANACCCLSQLLHCVELNFVGFRIQHCLDALETEYGIKCRNALDLADIPNNVKPIGRFFDVDEARRICSAATFSEWGAATLSQQQAEAATMRAYLCFYASNCLYDGYLMNEDF
ncbi:hypothetical protein RDABS01_018128 [Bienertia sinuspersici]